MFFLSKIKSIFLNDKEDLLAKEQNFYMKSRTSLNYLRNTKYFEHLFSFLCCDDSCSEDKASLISYSLTGIPDSKYTWGLSEDLKKGIPEHDCISWISKDIVNHDYIDFRVPEIKLDTVVEPQFDYFVDHKDYQAFVGLHRSGWQKVFQCLHMFSKMNGIFVDTYVDRTFHWNLNFNRSVCVVPYLHEWYGFIHHPWQIRNSDYSSFSLFRKKEFLMSLFTCRGLFVFSRQLQHDIRKYLHKNGIKHVNVIQMWHPTETRGFRKFSMEQFDGSIISIGSWLRNVLSIFLMNTDGTQIERKYALKGKKMSVYFPPEKLTFTEGCKDVCALQDEGTERIEGPERLEGPKEEKICRHEEGNHVFLNDLGNWLFLNQYIESFWYTEDQQNEYIFYFTMYNESLLSSKKIIRMIKRYINSVTILNDITDAEYDDILSKKVVLLAMDNAVACNTFLECLVRRTPMLLSRLPVFQDILGKGYPLFFDSIGNIATILTLDNIEMAHEYLCGIDINNFEFEMFLNRFHVMSS